MRSEKMGVMNRPRPCPIPEGGEGSGKEEGDE